MAIDDDEINLMILSKTAEESGFSVLTFESTVEGWEHIQNHPHEVDIILLDKMMAEMSGLEFLKKLKSDKTLQHVPVIMQTGDVGIAQMREGLESGAYYYLTKPFHPDILSALLGSAAHECAMREELLAQVRSGQGENFRLLEQGVFTFHTHQQAQQLAAALAQESLYPEFAAVGLMELMSNAIEHGNLGFGTEEKQELLKNSSWMEAIEKRRREEAYANKRATLQFIRGQNSVDIIIRDEGEGFDWQRFVFSQPGENSSDTLGCGISKAMVMLDNLQYQEKGNVVACSMSTASIFN
jgi:CheY-like chemotaxis protein